MNSPNLPRPQLSVVRVCHVVFGGVLVCCVAALPTVVLGQVPSQAEAGKSPQDRIFFIPVVSSSVTESPGDVWRNREVSSLAGTVRKFDSEEVLLVDASGGIRRLDSGRVERIEIAWQNQQAIDALKLLEVRDYRAAITAFEAVLRTGVPAWKGRFLVNGMVQAANGLNRPRVAGIVFLQYLANSTPPALLFADMPLCWTTREPDSLLTEKAAEWLEAKDEASQLLGASWSLSGPKRQLAAQRLLKLQASDSKVIATLAACQTWRTVSPNDTLKQFEKWDKYRNSLIRPLQLGPTEFMADRLMRIGEVDLALGQLLRIASIHSDSYHRSLNALQVAQKLLDREGHAEEAERVREWIEELRE